MSARDLAYVISLLNPDNQALGEMLNQQARDIGDVVHAEIKHRIPSHPTVRATIAVGVSVAAQVLAETMIFADRSMADDPDDSEISEDASAVRVAAAHLFAELFGREFPNLLRPMGDA